MMAANKSENHVDQAGTGTVARTTNLLRCLAEAERDVSIKFLADRLALAPSTVHRLLHLLIDQGFVERNPSAASYRVGPELFRLGALIANNSELPRMALPYMRQVVGSCDEFCMLNLYLPVEQCMMIAETVASSHPLSYGATKFARLPLVWGATGKAILAFLPAEEVNSIYELSSDSPADGRRLPALSSLLGELEVIRSRGYAHTNGEKMPGAIGIAAPLFDVDGKVLGSLSLTVPEIRFRPQRAGELADIIVSHAARLSHARGFRAPPRTPRLTAVSGSSR